MPHKKVYMRESEAEEPTRYRTVTKLWILLDFFDNGFWRAAGKIDSLTYARDLTALFMPSEHFFKNPLVQQKKYLRSQVIGLSVLNNLELKAIFLVAKKD